MARISLPAALSGGPARVLELHGVAKSYGQATALAPIDLHCTAGETTVLIGPSGCGKSTLLRMVAGLVTPDAGRIVIGGEILGPANLRDLRHRMGYVIQEGGLFPHLTARANLGLLPRHLGWSRERIEARIAELAQLVHVAPELLARYPAELSGGQRQRVSLVRALMVDPGLLLLDEPLGALDPMIRSRLQAELRDIFRRLGKTVVLVTHDIAEAAFFAGTIVLLQNGRVVQRGTLAELVEAPAGPFVTDFITAQRRPLEALLEATR